MYPSAYLYKALNNESIAAFQTSFIITCLEIMLFIYGMFSIDQKKLAYYTAKVSPLSAKNKIWNKETEKFYDIVFEVKYLHLWQYMISFFYGSFYVIAYTPYCFNGFLGYKHVFDFFLVLSILLVIALMAYTKLYSQSADTDAEFLESKTPNKVKGKNKTSKQ